MRDFGIYRVIALYVGEFVSDRIISNQKGNLWKFTQMLDAGFTTWTSSGGLQSTVYSLWIKSVRSQDDDDKAGKSHKVNDMVFMTS